jgi:hypothetical protein
MTLDDTSSVALEGFHLRLVSGAHRIGTTLRIVQRRLLAANEINRKVDIVKR